MAKTKKTVGQGDADTIIVPGANSILLGPALANTFIELKREASRNLVQIAVLAHKVREANKSQTAARALSNWFNKYGMHKVFGTRSNFTKYAQAGEVILNHMNVLGRDLGQLPIVVSALYEIHDLTEDELELCLENTYRRKSNTVWDKNEFTAPKKPKPVINPLATAKSIRTWKENWRNPPVPKTDKRTVHFITITADASIYDFDRSTAAPIGRTTLDHLRKIELAIAQVLKGQDSHVLVKSQMKAIQEGVERRRRKAEDALTKGAKNAVNAIYKEEKALNDKVLLRMRTIVKKRIAAAKKKVTAKVWKTMFSEEEVDVMNVHPHELDAKIREVLTTFGTESEYQAIRKEAEAQVNRSRLNAAIDRADPLIERANSLIAKESQNSVSDRLPGGMSTLSADKKAKFKTLKV